MSYFISVAFAVNMQKLKEMLADCWVISVAFDSATVKTSSFFDIRARFVVKEDLFWLHVPSLPMFGRDRGQNLYELFEKVRNVVEENWENTLLYASSDGVRKMAARVREVISVIASNLSPGRQFIRTWCGARQLDLESQNAVFKLCDGTFYHFLTGLMGNPS